MANKYHEVHDNDGNLLRTGMPLIPNTTCRVNIIEMEIDESQYNLVPLDSKNPGGNQIVQGDDDHFYTLLKKPKQSQHRTLYELTFNDQDEVVEKGTDDISLIDLMGNPLEVEPLLHRPITYHAELSSEEWGTEEEKRFQAFLAEMAPVEANAYSRGASKIHHGKSQLDTHTYIPISFLRIKEDTPEKTYTRLTTNEDGKLVEISGDIEIPLVDLMGNSLEAKALYNAPAVFPEEANCAESHKRIPLKNWLASEAPEEANAYRLGGGFPCKIEDREDHQDAIIRPISFFRIE